MPNNGETQQVTQGFKIIDGQPDVRADATGVSTTAKLTAATVTLDATVSGSVHRGSAFNLTYGADVTATWSWLRFGPLGAGFMWKTDGTKPATAGLPAAAAAYAGLMVLCTDSIQMCKHDGSAWVAVGAIP